MNFHLNRRSALQLGAAGALAAGFSVPAEAHPRRPRPTRKSKLSRPDRVFLERGLIHAAWIRSGPQDGWYPDKKLWRGAGFTTPQFYGEAIADSGLNRLEYSPEVMAETGAKTWSLARAPYPRVLFSKEWPDPEGDWMTPAMKGATKNLFTVCFGDEEDHSPELTDWLRKAFAKVHRELPNVLVHNNQALGQYAGDLLREYMQTAQPDLLTYDWYIWQRNPYHAGGSPTMFYQQLGRYRNTAMLGHDGTGGRPIAFGQYTIGFKLQPKRIVPEDRFKRRVYVSESQIGLTPYMTWAAGGKWLSLFRWEKDEEYPPWETDGLMLNDAEGKPLPAYYRYRRINADMAAFSPYLTRLRTQSFSRLGGLTIEGDPTTQPQNVAAFSPSVDPGSGVVGLTATNIGGANSGQRGDVILGTFRALPEMNASENRGVLPDRNDTAAFMIVNGLTQDNDDVTDPYSTGGTWEQTRQRITVQVQVPRGKELYRVTPRRGAKRVALVKRHNGYEFNLDIDGGTGALFIWG